MKILVTGAAGAIGARVARDLISNGHHVVALDVLESDLATQPELDVQVGDCRDVQVVRKAVSGVEGVIHLAGIPSPVRHKGIDVFSINTQATFTVLNEAAHAGVQRVVTASSISALGMAWSDRGVSPLYVPIDEEHPLRPEDAYGLAKQVDEATAAMMHRRYRMTIIALRFPFTTTKEGIADHARTNTTDPSADSKSLWAYLDIRDAARACRLAVTANIRAGFHIINVIAPNTLATTPTEELLERYHPTAQRRAPLAGQQTPYTTERAMTLINFTAMHVHT